MFRFCVNRSNLVINNDTVIGTVRIIYYFSMLCCLPIIWDISLVLSPVQANQGPVQPGLGHIQGWGTHSSLGSSAGLASDVDT